MYKDKLGCLTGNEVSWYKLAFRFVKNAGRKSAKRKAVRIALELYKENNISEIEAKNRIKATQPWQSHSPINP